MTVMLSPGVYVVEKDVSDIVPTLASASAAIVGYSEKGSSEAITLITNNQQFIQEYGEPDPSSGHYFHYAALAYLARGNTLYCLRVENGALFGGANIMTSTSAETNAAFVTGKSSTDFAVASGLEDDVLFQIMGANPGTWNSNIGVYVENVEDGSEEVLTDQYTFDIVVYYQDEDGNYSELERWNVSRKEKVDGFGKDLYLEDKINGRSQYIVVADNTSIADTVLPQEQATRLDLGGGTNGAAITDSDLIDGWDEFANPDDIDVRILINGGETSVAVQNKMKTVAEGRADCFAVFDVPWSAAQSPTDTVTFRTTTQNFNTSYGALYAPWVQIYDTYNDKLIFVPPSGHVAGQMAYNDFVGNPWNAPAGFRRGQLDVIQPSYTYSKGERDVLEAAQVNFIQMFRGEGTVIWAQKTLQKKTSALSSVNVRRMLIVIEKSMAVSIRPFLFENNNATTRFRVKALLDSYLEVLSAQGAFQTEAGDEGFLVVVDDTNNLPSVIDRLEMHVDVFLKPARAAEKILLQSIITPTGASFQELVARGQIF